MAALPEKARVVIIGQGGIVGASVAHQVFDGHIHYFANWRFCIWSNFN